MDVEVRDMNRAILGLLVAVILVLSLGRATAGDDSRRGGSEEFFELRVRPVLAGKCVKCHGASKQSGGLRLDSRAALLEGGEGGPAVIPGDPGGSPLVRAVRHA